MDEWIRGQKWWQFIGSLCVVRMIDDAYQIFSRRKKQIPQIQKPVPYKKDRIQYFEVQYVFECKCFSVVHISVQKKGH